MTRFIHTFILAAFVLAIFTSLWMLSTCGSVSLGHIQPFATYHNTCGAIMGTEHVQLWRDLLLTFIVSASIASLAGLVMLLVQRIRQDIHGKRLHAVSHFLQLPEQIPHMKFWDPLRFALAHGTVQHGSRNQ